MKTVSEYINYDLYIERIAKQAQALMSNETIIKMLNGCESEEEKMTKLAIASMVALSKNI